MRITQFDDIPYTERLPRHRDGRFEFKSLMIGDPASPGNFNFEAVRTYGDFFSPRHRHNFDQYRFQLEGQFDYDRNGKMVPGCVGYFPESTPYGPQSSSEDSLTLVLQVGGSSGAGYLSRQEFLAGSAELQRLGEFKRGAFMQQGEDGHKRNKDGFEAVWEYVRNRKLEYAAPRYQDPVFMHPENFSWLSSAADPGVCLKHLGTFGERCTAVGLIRLERGAAWTLPARSLCFVLSGEGCAGDARWKARSTLHVDEGESVRLGASSSAELLRFGLPDFSV